MAAGETSALGKRVVAIALTIAAQGFLLATVPATTHAADASLAAPSSAVQLAEQDRSFENPDSSPARGVLSSADEKFLDDLERQGISYFVDEADPVSGLMPDRAAARGGAKDVASIAAVGFGLTALCIGDERGWVKHQDAYDRSLRVLRFLRDQAPQEHGFFYHFLNMRTGQRVWKCEVSSIDTALLMCGVLTVRQHFPGTDLSALANELYEKVDWPWMLESSGMLSMGWKPEKGFLNAHFLNAHWDQFNEGPMIYLLGMGSGTHPLPADSWRAWRRFPVEHYAGLSYLQCPPLFTQQYPQAWFDLRGLRDDYADYFRNSQLATIAQRQWCIDELSKRFDDYSPALWGISASDGPKGYQSWGGPPADGDIDGTVVPCAAAGSMAFEPRLCLDVLENFREKYGDKCYLKYGFVDAFNPKLGWYDSDVLGIDVGVSVVMTENARTGLIWKTFMSCDEARRAIKAAGFRPLDAQESRSLMISSIFNESAPLRGPADSQ